MAALKRSSRITFGNIPDTHQINESSKTVHTVRWINCLITVSIILFVFSSIFLIKRFFEYREAEQEYKEYQGEISTNTIATTEVTPNPTHVLATIATNEPIKPQPSEIEPAYNKEIVALKAQNSHAIGWLGINGTNIQYPVVQASDNDYYTNHTFARKRNASGSIFLDYRNSSTLDDNCIIIYGHNMKDGSMFHDLRNYKSTSFLRANNEIVLTGVSEQKIFRVFAAISCSSDEILLSSNSFTKQEKTWMLSRIRARTVINKNGVFPDADDQLIALITCTGDSAKNHWVVYGYQGTN